MRDNSRRDADGRSCDAILRGTLLPGRASRNVWIGYGCPLYHSGMSSCFCPLSLLFPLHRALSYQAIECLSRRDSTMKSAVEHVDDQSSENSPIDAEKHGATADADKLAAGNFDQGIPDPDAGLTAEEKARMVWIECFSCSLGELSSVTRGTGQKACLETRHPIDPMALPALPHQFLGQDQHRKRQASQPGKGPKTHSGPIYLFSNHLLRVVCLSGTHHQCPSQTLPTQHLHPSHHACVGTLHDVDGRLP